MKLLRKQQAVEKKHNAAYTVIEHPLNNEKLDFAIAIISGRYPEDRRVVNSDCAELAYVAQGSGKIVLENVEQTLNAGDVILIEPGEKYFWDGNMQLFLTCRPAWNPGQHQIVD